ncbi:hypothetical protein UMM65_01525 [Aureibaculum sp. 2210JD6-5]|uniref:hypothetical protein n=1 Tax=Aureibaculum sp. 2210JD6-5 TaxID=3103957 RepID=UPI002AAE1AAA|nr:hypothetical protein [Aureibaculum sp. 2210JD6-5]MDY7393912.1 hypothetical protein [Aureibaculum sp. 2210JD6-5]
MISENFCQILEHKITQTFSNENDRELKSFWCDGVAKPENEVNFNSEYVEQKSEVELRAWFGETGQEVYKVILRLGENSKNKILNNSEIIDCIPEVNENWIELNEENKTLIINLK